MAGRASNDIGAKKINVNLCVAPATSYIIYLYQLAYRVTAAEERFADINAFLIIISILAWLWEKQSK